MYLTVYVIEVYTGDKAGAGTDAHVFVTLYGKRGQAPKTQLISRCGDKSIKSVDWHKHHIQVIYACTFV